MSSYEVIANARKIMTDSGSECQGAVAAKSLTISEWSLQCNQPAPDTGAAESSAPLLVHV